MDIKLLEKIKKEILSLPEKVASALLEEEKIKNIAEKLAIKKDVFYLGRGVDLPAAMEGALKLKEISYIMCQTYAGGELKHGPIALVEDGTVVVAVNTSLRLKQKTDSNIKEVVSRGAYVISIVLKSFENPLGDNLITIPDTDEIFTPVLSSVPLQLLSYYTAVKKGYNVDKPRNLAKSVTVE